MVSGVGCQDHHSPPGLAAGGGHRPGGIGSGGDGNVEASCDAPNEGCECDEVGQFAPCGDVTIRSGDYVTCSMGQRECMYDHVWGACVGDHVTTKYMPESQNRLQATTGPSACVGNACDPYCKVTGDDGIAITDLPSGLCSAPGGGLVACGPQCGYSGARAPGYASLNSAWKKQPTTCTPGAADTCNYDAECNAAGVCADWSFPCYDPTPAGCALTKKVDLELGPPCGTTAAYHFQLCNRGADRANAGTVKIGVYSSNAKLGTAVTSSSPGAPDQGVVTFVLGTTAGKYIDPGTCLDINASNSTAVGLSLTSRRAVAVNYDRMYANGECNYANNWHVYDSALACQGCVGLECDQTCASSSLTGTIKDPAGVNPLPGVVVYVPNGTVQPLTDGVACDSCSTLYSGLPITSAVTGYDGKFTLTNVPVGVSFPLVIQTGRWRRKVTVAAITGACGVGTPTAALPSGENSQLPSNAAEGDIPKIALSMSAGDHLECLLKKIGLEDGAFSAPSGTGRIHLYAYNGLTYPGTTCTPPTNGTCANDLWSSQSKLDSYNIVIAPCDKNSFGGKPAAYNPYVCNGVTTSCPDAGYGAGPFTFAGGKNKYGFTSAANAQSATNVLNTTYPPFPTIPDVNNPTGPEVPSAAEQNNLKAYIDKGGRLFATHWMAYFLTRTTYPNAVNYVFGSYVDLDRQAPNFPYTIDQSTPLGDLFADWVGGSTVTFTNWRHLALSVNAPAIRLAYGDSTQSPVSHPANSTSGAGGPMVSAFQFDAPWGVAAANQCGRVVVAESHVSKLAGSTASSDQQTPFPSSCDTTAMTGEEKSFEFLLFSATQCLGLVTPPAPVTPLKPATYTVDYWADCPDGTKPEWQFFSWKATVPTSTSIGFTAATASTQAGLASATPVSAGTATATTSIWTSSTSTVEQQLRAASPAQASRDWLRIAITINPNVTTTPTLLKWQQTFDCKPAE